MNKFPACAGFGDTETDKQANLTPETREKSPEEKAAEEVGYSLEAIKVFVNGITDRTTQRKLKGKQRNKTFARL